MVSDFISSYSFIFKTAWLSVILSAFLLLSACTVPAEEKEISITPDGSTLPGIEEAFEADTAVNNKYFKEALIELLSDRTIAEPEFTLLKTRVIEGCDALSSGKGLEESYLIFADGLTDFDDQEKNSIWNSGVYVYCPQNRDLLGNR